MTTFGEENKRQNRLFKVYLFEQELKTISETPRLWDKTYQRLMQSELCTPEEVELYRKNHPYIPEPHD